MFVADFAYLQDEEIPAFIAPRDTQQPARPAGFDYDVLNAEVLLSRAAAAGRPAGLARRDELSLPGPAARLTPGDVCPPCSPRSSELAESGVTIVGARPSQRPGADRLSCSATRK